MKQFTDTLTLDGGGYSFASEEINLTYLYGFAASFTWTDSAPSAFSLPASSVTVAADTFIEVAHGAKTGLKVVLSTDTTAPSGTTAGNTYYVIKTDDDSFQIASSSANAAAGTALPIYDQGVGIHTFTPDSLAGASIKLQATTGVAGDSWYDIPDSETSITGDSAASFNVREQFYTKIRAYITLTAGQLDVSGFVSSKGW